MAEKKQSKSERAQALMREQKRKERTRNLLVVGAVVVAVAIIAVVGFVVSNNNDTTGKAVGASGTPQNLTGAYNVEIGKSTAPDTIKLYEDFQCPICKDVRGRHRHAGRRRRSRRARSRSTTTWSRSSTGRRRPTTPAAPSTPAMAVLSTAGPDAFLKFHTIAYANQPAENTAGVPDSTLIQWAVQAGADEATVTPLINDNVYHQWVVNATDQMSKDGVNGTPTVFINGKNQGSNPQARSGQRPGAREVVQVERVQRWVMSTLLLTVCALFATGMAILSGTVDRAGARPGSAVHLRRGRADGDGGHAGHQPQADPHAVAAARPAACGRRRDLLPRSRAEPPAGYPGRTRAPDRLSRVSPASLLSDFIAGLPKVELHVHHVGSASPAIVSELAMRHPGVVPVDPEELQRFFEFRDFAHFVEVYLAVVDLIRTEDDVRYLTYEVARELAIEPAGPLRRAHVHAVHLGAAPRLRPRACRSRSTPRRIEDARIAAERDFGIVLRWIYDIPGESGMPAADATLSFALNHRTDALVGFGLGGPEIGVPRGQFQPHFDHARRAGLHSVPHAGETTGPETIWDSLRLLGAERIGHGTSAAADPELLDHLAATGIPLEVCPSSNIATRAVASLDEHPITVVPRRRRDDHGELRRPVDVRHQPQPGVRGRGATARPRHRRGGRPGPDRGPRVVRAGGPEGLDPAPDRRVLRSLTCFTRTARRVADDTPRRGNRSAEPLVPGVRGDRTEVSEGLRPRRHRSPSNSYLLGLHLCPDDDGGTRWPTWILLPAPG